MKTKSVRTFILMPTVQLHLKQKPTTIGLIKYEQPTRTKYATLLAERLIGSLQKRGVKKSSTPLPPSFP